MRTLRIYLLLFCVVLAAGLLITACEGDDDDDNDDQAPADDDDDIDMPELDEGFVFIPSGIFLMGSWADEPGARSDEAQHEVTFTRDFEMMVTEVTQGKFQEVMGYNPSHFPVMREVLNRPVEQVSWYDALAFCNKLSEAHGYPACYALSQIECADETAGDDADYCRDQGGIFHAEVALNGAASVYECQGFRLPTESEWEYAARAGTLTAFHMGPITQTACSPLDPTLDLIAWYCGNANMTHHPVAEKLPNPWGLFDMSGNVMEWTWDWYARDYPGFATDPAGPADGHFKVARGGAFRYYGAAYCRSAYRAAHTPGYRTRFMGFRPVRTLASSEPMDIDIGPSSLPIRSDDPAPPQESDDKAGAAYPDSLPFSFTRDDVGEPLTPEEIEQFTRKITGFYKQTQYIDWVLWTGHGMDASNPEGMPDYKLYWQDTRAIKEGDVVTFEHYGGADNLMIRTSKILNNAVSGYLMCDDPSMGRIVEQYSKGMVALYQGMMWADQDPEDYIMARAIFTQDHAYTEQGRQALVTYGPAKHEREDWNAHTMNNPNNPYWGDIWVRNMRSKDDVPHIFRTVPLLKRVAREGLDESVREAAGRAAQYVQGFARDIVDTGYYIRTKDKYGNAYIPLNEQGMVNDLASFELYNVIDPKAECDAKLASALIAYDDPLDIDCKNGVGEFYETIASKQHYFNWAIIRYFHVAALTNALMAKENLVAYKLMKGLAERVDAIMSGETNWGNSDDWDSDAAGYLLAAATAGLPLTSAEARHVVEQYSMSADHYQAWPNWDLWDPSVGEGEQPYKPPRSAEFGKAVREDEMLYLLEYCYSPFRNETSAPLVDCDIIADPDLWGE